MLMTSKIGATSFSEKSVLSNLLRRFTPIEDISTKAWAEREIFMSSEQTEKTGYYDVSVTPYMEFVMDCWDDSSVEVIVSKKSAQIGWSATISACIAKSLAVDKAKVMLAFPRANSGITFHKSQIKPLIENTSALRRNLKQSLNSCSYKFIPFDGCALYNVNSGTVGDIKSSPVPILVSEEPDDVKADLNGQGDTLDILQQRQKSFDYGKKLVFGGTPTNKDFSQVDRAYEKSNQLVYLVPCHECGEFHKLNFDNLKSERWVDNHIDITFGAFNPEKSWYECPACLAVWTDADRVANIKEAVNHHWKGWHPNNPSETRIYGFAFNELMSPFTSSSHVALARAKLEAEKSYEDGHEGMMKSFINNRKGEAYSAKNRGLDVEGLKERRLCYSEMVVPFEGLVLTCGVDVQWNRFAIIVRAWGRNGNSWLVNWTEIFGDVLDYSDPVWTKLEEFLTQKFPHASSPDKFCMIQGVAIDSGDGNTCELVYRFVRHMAEAGHTRVFAVKGAGELKYTPLEIYNEPTKIDNFTDSNERKSVAETMGVTIFTIGAYRAHEEVLRRINLTGTRDRYYHHETSYGGYEEQIFSCRKEYSADGGRASFKRISARHKEAIDCEKMALWVNYALGIRHYTNIDWTAIEHYIYSTKNL